LGSLIINKKKIQPIPNPRRCWDQPFSIGKVSSKSKTKNLKCQNEVILGDFKSPQFRHICAKFLCLVRMGSPKKL
jgi:hypothetical protein